MNGTVVVSGKICHLPIENTRWHTLLQHFPYEWCSFKWYISLVKVSHYKEICNYVEFFMFALESIS